MWLAVARWLAVAVAQKALLGSAIGEEHASLPYSSFRMRPHGPGPTTLLCPPAQLDGPACTFSPAHLVFLEGSSRNLRKRLPASTMHILLLTRPTVPCSTYNGPGYSR